MFGGVTFMLGGNMCCGVIKEDLVVRVGPDRFEEALRQPHTRPMDFSGRVPKGFVYVSPEGWRTEQTLAQWVRQAADFAESLPAKQARPKTPKSRGGKRSSPG